MNPQTASAADTATHCSSISPDPGTAESDTDSRARPLAIRPLTVGYNRFVALFSEMLANHYPVEEFRWAQLLVRRRLIVILHWPTEMFRPAGALDTIKVLSKILIMRIGLILGNRVVWVAHNVAPHDSGGNNRLTTGAFVKALSGIIYLSARSKEELEKNVPAAASIPSVMTVHGHYRDGSTVPVTPAPSATEQCSLGFIGLIRRYKHIEQLITMAPELPPEISISVVGWVQDAQYAAELEQLAQQRNSRIVLDFRSAPLTEGEFEQALDRFHGIVLPYRQITNSGAALLALSRNRSVLAPAKGSMPELAAAVGSRWMSLFSGDLGVADIIRFRDSLAENSRGGVVDLTAYGWDRVYRDLVPFLDRL